VTAVSAPPPVWFLFSVSLLRLNALANQQSSALKSLFVLGKLQKKIGTGCNLFKIEKKSKRLRNFYVQMF